jgi:hypothetical protein
LNSGALPLFPPDGTLASVEPWPLFAFVILQILHVVIRAGRSWFLLAPIANVPVGRIMVINSIAVALVAFLPFRLGELSRPVMLREKGKLSAAAVTGTVGAERILDGVIFSTLLLIGLSLARPQALLDERVGGLPVSSALVPRAALLASIAFSAAFLGMVVFYRWRAFARRLTERLLGLVSHRFAERIASLMERLSDGLKFLTNLRHAGPYVGVTALALAFHLWSMKLLADAVGIPELTLTQTAVVVGVLALGFAVPNAPGFFGTVQLALYAGLAVYIQPAKVVHEGAALVFIFYVTYLTLIIAGAAIGLAIEYVRGVQELRRGVPPETTSSS